MTLSDGIRGVKLDLLKNINKARMTFEKQLFHLSCTADIQAIIAIVKLRFRPSATYYYQLRLSAN